MFCVKCGTQLPDTAVVCYKCATPTVSQAAHQENFTATITAQKILEQVNQQSKIQPVKKNSAVGVIFGLLVAITIFATLALGIVFLRDINQNQQDKSNYSPSSIQQVLTTRHAVMNEMFTVPAGHYMSHSLSLPNSAHIIGEFYAKGGMKNDIECVIFDEIGFQNYQNGNLAEKVYYNSKGYVTRGKIDKTLPPGNYFLVFNNSDAFISSKQVTAQIEAEY